MKTIILGIDGLEKNLIDYYIEQLPNFKKVIDEGSLNKIDTVFPADSVPAWVTIFTGLNPAEHGFIRGKDYVESVTNFNTERTLSLKGYTFWDKLSEKGYKCLVVNPYLIYPAWPINGIIESGPAFIEGDPSFFPDNNELKFPESLGGYQPVKDLSSLKADMDSAYIQTEKLWDEFNFQLSKDNFDLAFVTFTTLDRIQHYTWRYFDKNDPLHKNDTYLSNFILKTLKLFDSYIGHIIDNRDSNDKLILISDHGFGQRPYNLINMNEVLRQNSLLEFNKNKSSKEKNIQKLKNSALNILSRYKLLDKVKNVARFIPFLVKLKKSDYLIDKINSALYVDELFCGKKPYCGLNYGEKYRNDPKEKEAIFQKLVELFDNSELPKPLWIKRNFELYSGKFVDTIPDICFELPPEYGLEFNFFDKIMTQSITHYRISGGHLGAGVFGYYSNCELKKQIDSILKFHDLVMEEFKN